MLGRVKNSHYSSCLCFNTESNISDSLQILLEGEVTSKPGYISIGGLYTTSDYCDSHPATSVQGKESGLVLLTTRDYKLIRTFIQHKRESPLVSFKPKRMNLQNR